MKVINWTSEQYKKLKYFGKSDKQIIEHCKEWERFYKINRNETKIIYSQEFKDLGLKNKKV